VIVYLSRWNEMSVKRPLCRVDGGRQPLAKSSQPGIAADKTVAETEILLPTTAPHDSRVAM